MTASQFKKQWWENSEEKKGLSCMQLPLFLSLVIYKWMHFLCTWQRVQEMQVISSAESISIYSINFRGKKNIVPSATVTYKMGLNNKRTIKRNLLLFPWKSRGLIRTVMSRWWPYWGLYFHDHATACHMLFLLII